MKSPKYQPRGSLEFNMTPMIDVTFLLIIFFLVSSNMAQQETAVELNLPSAESGRDVQDDSLRRITVNLTADGSLLLGGEAMDAAELGRRLTVERAQPIRSKSASAATARWSTASETDHARVPKKRRRQSDVCRREAGVVSETKNS